jgi:hypothetical protein
VLSATPSWNYMIDNAGKEVLRKQLCNEWGELAILRGLRRDPVGQSWEKENEKEERERFGRNTGLTGPGMWAFSG